MEGMRAGTPFSIPFPWHLGCSRCQIVLCAGWAQLQHPNDAQNDPETSENILKYQIMFLAFASLQGRNICNEGATREFQ